MRHHPLHVFLVILICGVVAFGQSKGAKPTPESTPKLDPLSDVEKTLDYRKLLQSQPDYIADEKYFYWEGFGGFGLVNKVGKKGPRSFQDTGIIRVLADGERTITMHPSGKNFEEVKDGGKEVRNLSGLVTQLLSREHITFVPLGIMTVGEYPAIRVEVKSKDTKSKVFLYFAKDLKYLVVASESIGPPPYWETRQLFNVSLEPTDNLFQVPKDYSPTPTHTWNRVTTAKVYYDDKPAKGASVFRSDDGNAYFVTLKEPHPATGLLLDWHYLVFPKKEFVEVGYQGTLGTEAGEFAWKTDAIVAFNRGEIQPGKDAACDKQDCPKLVATPNSLLFASVYWTDRKSMVKVVWEE